MIASLFVVCPESFLDDNTGRLTVFIRTLLKSENVSATQKNQEGFSIM
jgi:hypothetical protein